MFRIGSGSPFRRTAPHRDPQRRDLSTVVDSSASIFEVMTIQSLTIDDGLTLTSFTRHRITARGRYASFQHIRKPWSRIHINDTNTRSHA